MLVEEITADHYGNQLYSGIIKDIKYVPTEALTPGEKLHTHWNTINAVAKQDGKTLEQWAEWWLAGMGRPPIDVLWIGYNGWDLVIKDGHHRYLAAKILKRPLRVKVEAINVKVEWIKQFIKHNNEELKNAS